MSEKISSTSKPHTGPSSGRVEIDRVKIGRVGKAHGLRGDFFVSGRESPIPKQYGVIYIGESLEQAKPTKIEKSGWVSERPVVRCTLASDRSAADLLSGLSIWVDEASVVIDDASEYLWSDLEGRQVNDSAGICIGRVRAVYNAGAGDILEIEDGAGRILDISMNSQYVDMSFTRGGSELSLAVTADFFSDLWQENKPKPAPKARPPKPEK